MEDLVSAIRAFETIIRCPAEVRLSPAYGSLLGHLFSQLEISWRGEVFGVDIRLIQLVLLKKILLSSDGCTNLVIWTAGLKEIKMLSGQAKEFVINWILESVKNSDQSDWPVIFHNLICMSAGNANLLLRIFEEIYSCLALGSRALLDHLTFLIGQHAKLGKLWVKWVLARGPLKINPLVFSGLLSLSQLDSEYFNLLSGSLQANIKLMCEIWSELRRVTWNVSDPCEYLRRVAGWIGSDSELGIRGALQLIDALKATNVQEMRCFYLELYRLHPFARRELLQHLSGLNVWRQVYEIDSIILREHVNNSGNAETIGFITEEAPELLFHLIEHEDQLEGGVKALMAVNSVLLGKSLKNLNSKSKDLDFSKTCCLPNIPSGNEISLGECLVLKEIFEGGKVDLQDSKDVLSAKMVELCELLKVPGAIEENRRSYLIDLAVEFVASEFGSGIYSERERISLISKLISTNETDLSDSLGSSGSFGNLLKLFEGLRDWTAFSGTLKFILERISVPSEAFYNLIPRIPADVEFQILLCKAICNFKETTKLNEKVAQLIGSIAGRVVSEPQLSKSLLGLLSREYAETEDNAKISLTKFTEISDPIVIKLIVEFGLKYAKWIEGDLKGEVVKSILMFYGKIEEDGEGEGSADKSGSATSKFKNIHLNEKSVNFCLNSLLTFIQRDLEMAHKLVKHVPELVEREVDEFLGIWLEEVVGLFVGLTKGLVSGRGAVKLHVLLASFYDLCTKLIQLKSLPVTAKCSRLIQLVAGQLNKQVYALIPLQQDKIQSTLKQALNLKKDKSTTNNGLKGQQIGKSITKLIYEMEKFEQVLISRIRLGEKWCEKIVRSTARDFKIRLDQL